jgi:hypothetical protein
MGSWTIRFIDFEPDAEKAMKEFIKKNSKYKKMLEDRINDLLNFPELVWASALFDKEDSDLAEFVTYHQQLDLAGYAKRGEGKVVITHFEFHR